MQYPSVYLKTSEKKQRKKKRKRTCKKIKEERVHTLKKDNSDNSKGHISSNISLIERKF